MLLKKGTALWGSEFPKARSGQAKSVWWPVKDVAEEVNDVGGKGKLPDI